MVLLILKIILLLLSIQSIAKFLVFFLVKKETRMKMAEKMYKEGSGEGSATKVNDIIIYGLIFAMIILLFISGIEYVNFITGFMVGLTVLQMYLHSFNKPLEKEPARPLTPVKMMSFAIKEMPQKGLFPQIIMTLGSIWFIIMMIKDFLQ